MITEKSQSTVVDFLTCSNCQGTTHKLVPLELPNFGATVCIDCGKFLFRVKNVWDHINKLVVRGK